MIRMNVERFRIWVGFAIISFVWGSTWLAIKIGLGSAPPFFAAAIRFAIAASILFLIVRSRQLHVPLTPDAKRLYLVLGFLSFGIPYALVYWGEQFIPSGLCSVLFAAYPFWVAIFSHFLLSNERLDPFKVSGILLGFAGLVVIFSGDLEWSGPSGLLGMAAIMTSTMIQGFALIMIKKYGQPVNPFAMNLVGMTIGAIVLAALGVAFERDRQFVFNGAAVGSILYLATVGSVVAFVTYHWLLKRIEAVYISLTTFIHPVIAVVLGAIVLGEILSTTVFAGSGLVLAGILTANGKQMYRKVHARR
jgi:drug/metabolite transporter (DMT)-like permease